MCWAISINTIVAAGVAGINTTDMTRSNAARLFFKVSLSKLSRFDWNANMANQIMWVEGIFLCAALAAVKISILLFYRRIFVTRMFKRCVDIMVVVLVGWMISGIVVSGNDFILLFCWLSMDAYTD